MKPCYVCHEIKPLAEFHRQTAAADGYRNKCKACRTSSRKDRYHADQEAAKQAVRNWGKENPEKLKAKRDNWNKKLKANGDMDMMTQAKIDRLIGTQSAILRKIFKVVPIQEEWTVIQIKNALALRERSSADIKVVCGCLNNLKEQGLIKEPKTGHFTRAEIREEQPQQESLFMKISTGKLKPEAVEPQTPVDTLGSLSAQLIAMSDDFCKHAKVIARKIEDAALAIEQSREEGEAEAQKLSQLKALLKSL